MVTTPHDHRSCAFVALLLGLCPLAAFAAVGAPGAAPQPIANPVCRSFQRTGNAGDAATDALPDGTVWYADKTGNRIVRINPDRTLTPVVPADATTGRLSGIALGPDGNVWYAKDNAGRVGRIPPGGGEGIEFDLPERNSYPSSLIVSRNGQLWFQAPIRHYIGRLGTDGSVVVHRGPTAHSSGFTPVDLTVGPDGNLWASDLGHNAIYRFDVASSQFRRFDIATPNAHPGAITAGADGNLWFTMSAARKVGRITPSGAITEFDLGGLSGVGRLQDIVGTADGTIWVTASGRFTVRIMPDGTVQAFQCAWDLKTALVGPSGTPWFFGQSTVWVVEDANAPQAPRSTVAAPVAGALPWPVAGMAPPATPSPVQTLTLRNAIDRLPATRGRAVLQITSRDTNCQPCVSGNATLDRIAARRAKDAIWWRVTQEPWTAAIENPDAKAADVRAVPTIIVFQDGKEVNRVLGVLPENDIEAEIFGTR